MRKLFLLTIITIGLFTMAKAQTSADSIIVARGFLGYSYIHKNTRLNFNQLPSVLQGNARAYEAISKARKTNTVATVLSGAGGFLIVWQLGTTLFGGEPNWVMVGAAGGLVVASIPLFIRTNRLTLEAIDMYNTRLTVKRRSTMLKAALTSRGVGLLLQF